MSEESSRPFSSSALRSLSERGFLEQASDTGAIDDALGAGRLTFYVGFDPTAPSLHAGHLLGLMAMRLLQNHGHRPIAVLGGGTALVGDPSGKTEMRKMLSREQIAEHTAAIRRQLERFLSFEGENAAILLDNAEWLLPLNYVEFLRDIGVHFTVNRMVATKTYRERLDAEQPLSFIEFNYQLLQAYDFLHLYRQYGCSMQCGGSDQWGNMVAGVELIRRIAGRERGLAQCLTWPLLVTADGKKMGKTERGAVWLDPELFSPFEYYQYWISCDDRDVAALLRFFSDLPLADIAALTSETGAALREAKARLAFEATRLLHGDEAARQAEAAARQAFGKSEDWSAVPMVELASDRIRLIDLVVHEDIAAFKSKREAKQRIEAGAVRIDGEVCSDPNRELAREGQNEQGWRLEAGKKIRYRVRLGG